MIRELLLRLPIALLLACISVYAGDCACEAKNRAVGVVDGTVKAVNSTARGMVVTGLKLGEMTSVPIAFIAPMTGFSASSAVGGSWSDDVRPLQQSGWVNVSAGNEDYMGAVNLGVGGTEAVGILLPSGIFANGKYLSRLDDIPVEKLGRMKVAVKGTMGARHIASDAHYLDELLKTGQIPANSRGTYFTLDGAYDALTPFRLQVPHDGAIRVQFGLSQLGDDIAVPLGNWGKGPHLEPIARDFPDFGFGGATQRITTSPIQADRIIDTRTGKILFQRN